MNDQKRLIVFLVLVFVFYYTYVTFFAPKQKPVSKSTEIELTDQQDVKENEALEISQETETLTPAPLVLSEQTSILENDLMRIELSNKGGVISSIILKQSEIILDKPQQIIEWKQPEVQPLFLARLGAYDFGATEMFKVTQEKGSLVEYTREIAEGIQVIKRIRLENEKFRIRFEMEINNTNEKPVNFSRGLDVVCCSIMPASKKEGIRNIEINSLFSETSKNFKRKRVSKIKQREVESGRIQWTAMKSKFFALILDPDEDGMGVVYDFVTNDIDNRVKKQYFNEIRMDPFALNANEKRLFSFSLYAGPKKYNLLESYKRGYEELMGFRGPFGFLIKLLLTLMIWFYGIVRNYGVAIILVSALTKVIFYPLTQKSFKSMQQMQALQPLINEIKEQYKDNPKKQQQETMALYKKHKVNPLGGCLPLLFQMPIFIALFRMLSGSVELRGADFLWIKDLTLPDTIFTISSFNINILPLVMGFFMFLQQRMTPATDPSQKKMVMFMPLIFTVIFYNMPSGLVLYWLVNNVLTIGQQYLIKKQGVVLPAAEEAK